ncbi:FAD/NAD(P)-binding protein [Cypionkella sinensis]|uniref:FAD/NAD(P)-binding protein n=1 Tax=Cypionkella sinensis TaxID=1756043 RepID=A0ABV7IX54_9RHOB
MQSRIAIVGTGPTGVYAFKALSEKLPNAAFSLFERGDEAGVGMPYSAESSSRYMLANIASIEIPPVTTTYLEWLKSLPADRLHRYDLTHKDLHDRLFTPRLLLGEYFRAQFLELCDRAVGQGSKVVVAEQTSVTDVIVEAGQVYLLTHNTATDVERREGPFDRIVLATGHDFPDEDEATRRYFPSPWSGLIQADIPAARVGIMGTSLSSIDAAMAVVNQHGRFRAKGDDLTFQTKASDLHVTLMSWTGVLPEADFYCPLPYRPLKVMTDEAIARAAASDAPLDAMFALLQEEVSQVDSAYARKIGLQTLTADTFEAAYFETRLGADPFRWARKNLDEVERNKANKVTVAWRYALLRMHEKFEEIVPELNEADRARFDAGLKKVFVDNYAAVPSESIRRLLALRDAGVLSVMGLGEDYKLDHTAKGTVIVAHGETHKFDVFIDARGQKPLTSKDIPFPSLRAAVLKAGQEIPQTDERFCLTDVPDYAGRVYLAALPWLMHDRPFVQGITASAGMAEILGEAVAA